VSGAANSAVALAATITALAAKIALRNNGFRRVILSPIVIERVNTTVVAAR
jgi:hypothetical protein